MASSNMQRPRAPPLSEFPPLSAGSPPEQISFPPNSASIPRAHLNNGPKVQPRPQSGEFRPHQPNGKAVPAGAQGHMGPRNQGSLGGSGGFGAARSPPNTKNTSHVPCKFFKQGQCQAGAACPFSHSLDVSKFETPCKYFSKGNCKFGQKCALLHVLPNGRIVNRGAVGSMGHLNIGNRVDPPPYQQQESALGNSLLSQQGNTMNQLFGHQLPVMPDVSPNLPPTIHTQPFDIPRDNDMFGSLRSGEELRQPMSPPTHNTSLAEAKLPASFDSNGYSYMAMYGPVAASVPARFGIESPPHSLPNKANVPTDTLRTLHDSAFHPAAGARAANLGSSPSGPLPEAPGPRVLHSQQRATSKPRMISSSVPRPPMHQQPHHDDPLFAYGSDDAASDGGAGEEYVPSVLSHLLSPDERQRRSSGKVENPIAIRGALVGDATHPHSSESAAARFGSPSAASPSRFSALFSKQKDEQNGTGFSHTVGSPFRSGASHLSPSLRPTQRPPGGNTDFSSPFGVSSPPRHPTTSALSQQLKRMHLSGSGDAGGASGGAAGSSPGLHPPLVGAGRHASNPRSSYDRTVSGASANANRIDEEQEFVFSLDDEDDLAVSRSPWGNQKSPLGSVGDGRHSLGGASGDVKSDASNAKAAKP